MLDQALETLSCPRSLFRKIKEGGSPSPMFLVLSGWLSVQISLFLILERSVSFFLFLLIFVLSLGVILAGVSIKSSWIHFTAEMAGGEGKASKLFRMLCYSFSPLQLSLPLTLLFFKFNPLLLILLLFGLLFWSASLGVKAVGENYSFPISKSIAVLFSPFLILLVILLFLAALTGTLIQKYFSFF